jgi:hypothetical protein
MTSIMLAAGFGHVAEVLECLNSNKLPNSPSSSTATCKYTLVVNTLACPAAARTSANVRPPAKAWLINVCRPWWIVSVRSRAKPSTLQAVRNLRRKAARCSGRPRRCDCTEQTNGSLPNAPCSKRSPFHACRSASVPASHQRGTRRARRPFVISRRRRRCGRWTSITTSSS